MSRYNLGDTLYALLEAVVDGALDGHGTDAPSIITSDANVRNHFIEFCRALREEANYDVALVEFGPLAPASGDSTAFIISDSDRARGWPIWNRVISADDEIG